MDTDSVAISGKRKRDESSFQPIATRIGEVALSTSTGPSKVDEQPAVGGVSSPSATFESEKPAADLFVKADSGSSSEISAVQPYQGGKRKRIDMDSSSQDAQGSKLPTASSAVTVGDKDSSKKDVWHSKAKEQPWVKEPLRGFLLNILEKSGDPVEVPAKSLDVSS